MPRYTFSPSAAENLLAAFGGGSMRREQARGLALANTRQEIANEEARRVENARANLRSNYLRTKYSDEDAHALEQYFSGKRMVEAFNPDGSSYQTPLRLPEGLAGNPEALTALGREFAHLQMVDAYAPSGAGQIQQGWTLNDQREAQFAKDSRNAEYGRLAAAFAQNGNVDAMNRMIAVQRGQTYEPYAVSGGMSFNKATGLGSVTPVGQADIDYRTAQTDRERVEAVKDAAQTELYRANAAKSAMELQGLVEKAGLGDPFFRDAQGNIIAGATEHLPATAREALYTSINGSGTRVQNFEAYQRDYADAVRGGYKNMQDYLVARQKQLDAAERFYNSIPHDPNDYGVYSRGVDDFINDLAWQGKADAPAVVKALPNAFWKLNRAQKEDALEQMVANGQLSQEQAKAAYLDLFPNDK